MNISIIHLFFFTCFFLLKMDYLDHLLEYPIGPSLKVVQSRRLFDWTNMAAALPQFFGAARHPCVEVRGSNTENAKSLLTRFSRTLYDFQTQFVRFSAY